MIDISALYFLECFDTVVWMTATTHSLPGQVEKEKRRNQLTDGLPIKVLQLQLFYSPLSRTTRVSRYENDKPFWILLKQIWWGSSSITWTICSYTSFQIYNHANTSSFSFLWAGCCFYHLTKNVKALKAYLSSGH